MNGPPTKVLPLENNESDSLFNASDFAVIIYSIVTYKDVPEMQTNE